MSKQTVQSVPSHERMRVGLILAFVGGYLEAYTYMLHGRVFANAQTGNMALFAINLMLKNSQAWYYLVPIGAFLLGVIVSEWLRGVFSKRQWAVWEHTIVLIEAVLLTAIAFVPSYMPDAVVNVAVAFVCSLQFNAFRKTHGMVYATTFCTGNLRSAGEYLYHAVTRRDWRQAVASARYFGVIFIFMLGSAVAMVFIGPMGNKAVLVCSALCLLVWALMRRCKE